MRNELKRRMKRGEQAYGCWITIESPIVTEMLSASGFDYFVFDTEHSPLDIFQTQTLMQVMKGTDTTPIVRVWWNNNKNRYSFISARRINIRSKWRMR